MSSSYHDRNTNSDPKKVAISRKMLKTPIGGGREEKDGRISVVRSLIKLGLLNDGPSLRRIKDEADAEIDLAHILHAEDLKNLGENKTNSCLKELHKIYEGTYPDRGTDLHAYLKTIWRAATDASKKLTFHQAIALYGSDPGNLKKVAAFLLLFSGMVLDETVLPANPTPLFSREDADAVVENREKIMKRLKDLCTNRRQQKGPDKRVQIEKLVQLRKKAGEQIKKYNGVNAAPYFSSKSLSCQDIFEHIGLLLGGNDTLSVLKWKNPHSIEDPIGDLLKKDEYSLGTRVGVVMRLLRYDALADVTHNTIEEQTKEIALWTNSRIIHELKERCPKKSRNHAAWAKDLLSSFMPMYNLPENLSGLCEANLPNVVLSFLETADPWPETEKTSEIETRVINTMNLLSIPKDTPRLLQPLVESLLALVGRGSMESNEKYMETMNYFFSYVHLPSTYDLIAVKALLKKLGGFEESVLEEYSGEEVLRTFILNVGYVKEADGTEFAVWRPLKGVKGEKSGSSRSRSPHGSSSPHAPLGSAPHSPPSPPSLRHTPFEKRGSSRSRSPRRSSSHHAPLGSALYPPPSPPSLMLTPATERAAPTRTLSPPSPPPLTPENLENNPVIRRIRPSAVSKLAVSLRAFYVPATILIILRQSVGRLLSIKNRELFERVFDRVVFENPLLMPSSAVAITISTARMIQKIRGTLKLQFGQSISDDEARVLKNLMDTPDAPQKFMACVRSMNLRACNLTDLTDASKVVALVCCAVLFHPMVSSSNLGNVLYRYAPVILDAALFVGEQAGKATAYLQRPSAPPAGPPPEPQNAPEPELSVRGLASSRKRNRRPEPEAVETLSPPPKKRIERAGRNGEEPLASVEPSRDTPPVRGSEDAQEGSRLQSSGLRRQASRTQPVRRRHGVKFLADVLGRAWNLLPGRNS